MYRARFAHFGGSSVAKAARSVVEQLESRMLLSSSGEGVVVPLDAIANHQLTSEQMESLGLVSMNWNGKEIYAKSGEWIVQLTTAEKAPQVTADGEPVFDPKLKATYANRPSVNQAEFFETVGEGISFNHYLGSEDFLLIKAPVGVAPDDLQAAFRALPNFSTIEPNTLGTTAATTPDDTSFGVQWGLNNTGQTGGASDADIDAPEAWDISVGWSGAVVGVIDTGVDYNHPDLAGNIWTNPGEIAGNLIDDDANGVVDDVHGADFANGDGDPMDDRPNSHGTHVAGTIAAVGNNTTGVTGVAWDATIMAIKWIDSAGSGAIANAISAINYATTMRNRGVNIRVTNNSWRNLEGYSSAMETAIQNHGNAGILFVAAAANDALDIDVSPVYPPSYTLSNIISVAATDKNDNLASFSNYGATSVDLGAPGVGIYSTTRNSTYGYLNGTSMAAPHVAGVAALCFTVNPDATYQQVRNAILNGVDSKSSLNGKTSTGGRLNAYGALQQMTPASVTLNGDLAGVAAIDSMIIEKDPSASTYILGKVNGVQQFRRLASSLSSIAVFGMGSGDTITVASDITIPVRISAGAGNDSATGGAGNDNIDGGSGNDTLAGTNGNDTVGGADGNDSLFGGAGQDTLSGLGGNDTLFGGSSGDYIAGGNHTDTVDYSTSTVDLTIDFDNVADDGAAGEGDNVESTVENVITGSGNNYVYGSASANSLVGGAGNDTLIGAGGDDTLVGADGADRLDGGSDQDLLSGGKGNDTLIGGSSGDIFAGGASIDLADYSASTVNLVIDLDNAADDGASGEGDNVQSDVENVTGGGGADVIYGSPSANALTGGTGNDYLDGKEGNDTLSGAGGNDTLIGSSAGTDSLLGDAGNDLFYLMGDPGSYDTAWGGSGTDTLGNSDPDDTFFE